MDRKEEKEGGEGITKEVLTAEDLALYLGFNKNWVYRKAEAGELPGAKIGNRWRFKRSVIDRWLEGRIEQEREKRVPPGVELKAKAVEVGEELPPKAAELLERVFEVIEAHPEGVTLQGIGDELGLGWRRLTSFVNRLVVEGRVKKEGRGYFPAGLRGGEGDEA